MGSLKTEHSSSILGASLVAQMAKNLPANWEMRVWSLGWEDPLEKDMVSHSSILAWRIPWTEEPCRLQSMGSQRVGHDWVTNTFTFLKGLEDPKKLHVTCRFLLGEKDNLEDIPALCLTHQIYSGRPYNPCSSKCSLNQLYHYTSSLITLVQNLWHIHSILQETYCF